jgi:hypothetical protein
MGFGCSIQAGFCDGQVMMVGLVKELVRMGRMDEFYECTLLFLAQPVELSELAARFMV